jgi:hypothetical protein
MNKEEFIESFMWNQKQTKVRQAMKKDSVVRYYNSESYHDRNKGKQKDYKMRGVNSDR